MRRGSGSRRCCLGLANLALHGLDQNRIWCAIVSLACEITAWLQMLAFSPSSADSPVDGASHPARRWEPKVLRLRLLSAAGRLSRSGRRVVLHLSSTGRWTPLLLAALTRLRGPCGLRALPGPAG